MRAATTLGCLFTAVVAIAGCEREKVGTVAGPPLTIEPASRVPADAGPSGAAAARPPVTATFIDLSRDGAPIAVRPCEEIVVAIARGRAHAIDEDLASGDLLVVRGGTRFDVRGEGLALLAAVHPDAPCEEKGNEPLQKRVIRAAAAPELTWADGQMHASLDLDRPGEPAYVGRLRGTAPVAEHTHAGSWEVLGAIEGAGTFTLDGRPNRLAARSVVIVPPDTKHAWKPDDGSNLTAIQLYVPPGPEQRFKALSASIADAGSPVDAAAAAPQDAGAKSAAVRGATPRRDGGTK